MSATAEEPKGYWEIAVMKFLFRLSMACFFILYIFLVANPSLVWAKMKWMRMHDFSYVVGKIEKAIEKGEPGKALKWLQLWPISQSEMVLNTLEPMSSKLDTGYFFEFSRRAYVLERLEDAVFWSQYARFRLRYDAVRCGNEEAVPMTMEILQFTQSKEIDELLAERPERVKGSVRRVLDFDAKYPPENSPKLLCDALNALVAPEGIHYETQPEDRWEKMHEKFRAVTEDFLSGKKEELEAAEKKAEKETEEKKGE